MKKALLFVLVICLVAVASGCGKKIVPSPAASALLRSLGERQSIEAEVLITDGKQLNDLLAFFGSIEDELFTDTNSKWKEAYRVSFAMDTGMTITVMTSEDGTIWSSGSGDKALGAGFNAFAESLLAAAPAPAAEQEAAKEDKPAEGEQDEEAATD